jgi:hypothetical protein
MKGLKDSPAFKEFQAAKEQAEREDKINPLAKYSTTQLKAELRRRSYEIRR